AAYGFDGQGDVQNMSPLLFEKYHDAAGEVATAVLSNEAALTAAFGHDVPLAGVLPQLLSRAFRRPVSPEEVAERLADCASLRASGLGEEQVQHALLRSMLVSPSFLLRPE